MLRVNENSACTFILDEMSEISRPAKTTLYSVGLQNALGRLSEFFRKLKLQNNLKNFGSVFLKFWTKLHLKMDKRN